MKRTTLSLPDELAYVLRREARRRDSSMSEVAREALKQHFGLAGGKRKVAFAAIGRSGHADTAERAEEILAAEWPDHIEEDSFGGRRS